jgi:hypothetical protein
MSHLPVFPRRFLASSFAGWAVLAVLLVIPGGARAVVLRNDVSRTKYQALCAQKQFAPVGEIEVNFGFGYQQFASAVLVSNTMIISAGHVFDRDAELGAIAYRFVISGQVIPIKFKSSGVVTIAPGYNPVTLINDVSAAFLSKAVKGVTPATLYAGRTENGFIGTMVGFGDSGTGLTGDEFNDSKLAGQNSIDLVNQYDLVVDFDSPTNPALSSLGSPYPLPLEAVIGPGDSGGGLFFDTNGHWVVAGVNSYGYQALGSNVSDTYGWQSGFTRVSSYVSFITTLAKKHKTSVKTYTPPKKNAAVIELLPMDAETMDTESLTIPWYQQEGLIVKRLRPTPTDFVPTSPSP